jgi:hypothetical protein
LKPDNNDQGASGTKQAVARQGAGDSLDREQRAIVQEPRPNRFLATLGVILLAAAIVGFFTGRNPELCGGFLIVGAALSMASVAISRMEGRQELKLTGLIFNLGKTLQEGEDEISTKGSGSVPSLKEVVKRGHRT